jgi:hypothetical protein
MSNDLFMRGGLLARGNGTSLPARSYAGVNADRRSRFDARSARRYGDWGILAIPTATLWFDELAVAAAADDELDVLAPAIIDIWS